MPSVTGWRPTRTCPRRSCWAWPHARWPPTLARSSTCTSPPTCSGHWPPGSSTAPAAPGRPTPLSAEMRPGQLPRVVVVTRPTEYEQLLAEHGTRGQAQFFLHLRGRDIAEPEERHHRLTRARVAVTAAIPRQWRRGSVTRADLDRFLF